MRRISSRTVFMLTGLALVGALGIGVPEYLSGRVQSGGEACLGPGEDGHFCRFVGGPIQIGGTPVFVEKFKHAFLPTTAQIDFVDGFGRTWTAPVQTLTDGASIPAVFEPLMGDRQSREYLEAAALHDAYCGVGNEALETYQTKPWEDVHRMFYEALLVAGTPPAKAKIIFAAVYLGGPRWNDPDRTLEGVEESALLREMEWCLKWIEETDPSADEIVDWMKAREMALKAGDSAKPDYLTRRGI
ncbi:DUF1353 domain-containing protein [Tropicibacter oceani]|uniref:DUF1353 domain-containing protein n=1 Tax=Tropicibacter oceani TaxID=3058420 RepID=A0ABY8QGS7_9RHOB|nr:DUF1353 domain-containing protein [Tropicibacter oceani]WGW03830.1 DUF1353 domain-containing protein [Tropicibacter oceani]